ncbi:malonic semialdehyde reductase [Microbulbifer sp. VAAF005]|uniref:malonic semialdehyde reductase n=1 Tax=Microbulbifer sp. VAAF005 TaxID=3034230 RepID=UPI0024ADBFB9|nr:malonic semialdehyde reductase [Microbulbifer sp. VAAF005]WHI46523.1 malonic semialdehyde reductase [Microbulbifer sp. VAAF005]
MQPVSSGVLDQLFNEARTHSYWQDRPVSEAVLKRLYDLVRFGPTSANCCPMRLVFVVSKEAKERLKPALNEGNIKKTMQAPVTAIVAYDMHFYENLPRLYPQTPAREWFADNPEYAEVTAFRNSSLQGGTLFWLRGHWGLIADLCRDLIMRWSMRSSSVKGVQRQHFYLSTFLTALLNLTSCATWGMEKLKSCIRVIPDWILMRHVGRCKLMGSVYSTLVE